MIPDPMAGNESTPVVGPATMAEMKPINPDLFCTDARRATNDLANSKQVRFSSRPFLLNETTLSRFARTKYLAGLAKNLQ